MMSAKRIWMIVVVLLMLGIAGCGVIVTPAPLSESPPTPTYPHEDLLPQIEALLQYNETCELPCWWGFRMGEADIDSWFTFLRDTGLDQGFMELDSSLNSENRTGGGHISLDFSPHEDFEMGFYAEDGLLMSVEMVLSRPNYWLPPESSSLTIPNVIAQLGNSPEIYISTDRFRQVLLNDVGLVLISDEDGLIIYYSINISEVQLQPLDLQRVQICLGIPQTALIWMRLQDPNSGEPFGTGIRETLNSTENSSYRSLSEVFDTNDEEFIQYFLENPEGCLEVAHLGNH